MAGHRLPEAFQISSGVTDALRSEQAVVALETTLVTHGFPSDEGLALALELEAIVRKHDAEPATIGVLDGLLTVGLSRSQLELLASSESVDKLSLGNLAAGIVSGRPGSTTVAATVLAAHRAGIEVFATGGIGGVHRDVGDTGDVSADLVALGRYPTAVVCSGAKAILDLGRTLEALETLGVPVYGYRSDRFPAFYRRDSGLRVDRGFHTCRSLAKAIRTHFDLGTETGVVVGNPIPPSDEMPAEIYQKALDRAAAEAKRRSLEGREVTPFLLERVRQLTGGASSAANRALLHDNVRLAAELANELRKLPP